VSELNEKAAELEERLAELEDFFDLEAMRSRAAALGEEMSDPGFWDDQEEAREVSAEFSRVEGKVRLLDGLRTRLSDAGEIWSSRRETRSCSVRLRKSLRVSRGRLRSRR
jgi:peptide chain release factor 2